MRRFARKLNEQELKERISRLEGAVLAPAPELPDPDFSDLETFASGGLVNIVEARKQAALALSIIKEARRKAGK